MIYAYIIILYSNQLNENKEKSQLASKAKHFSNFSSIVSFNSPIDLLYFNFELSFELGDIFLVLYYFISQYLSVFLTFP